MPVIGMQDLHRRYRDHVAVHDVSFTVEAGEISGVLGPSSSRPASCPTSCAHEAVESFASFCDVVVLDVRDDGVGFDPARSRRAHRRWRADRGRARR